MSLTAMIGHLWPRTQHTPLTCYPNGTTLTIQVVNLFTQSMASPHATSTPMKPLLVMTIATKSWTTRQHMWVCTLPQSPQYLPVMMMSFLTTNHDSMKLTKPANGWCHLGRWEGWWNPHLYNTHYATTTQQLTLQTLTIPSSLWLLLSLPHRSHDKVGRHGRSKHPDNSTTKSNQSCTWQSSTTNVDNNKHPTQSTLPWPANHWSRQND